MISTERLGSYLNDHLGGSAVAIDLVQESRRQNEGSAFSQYLGSLVDEIEEDRETLVAVMQRLGVEPSQLKEASGWVAEKVSRLKFQLPLGADQAVNRLLEIDALLSGIFGKELLWQTLRRVANVPEPRLAGFDFAALEARATAQIDALNHHRLETFTGIFADGR
jgi:hypothetical protein